jgi:serine/threonine protein kinase
MASGETEGASKDAWQTADISEGGVFNVESLWRLCERVPETVATDPLVGRSFGGVTLVRFIAEGGMGRVYEAEQANPARRVAVKVLRPGFLNRETTRRFVREVSTLASLQHPWITQVYSAGTYDVAGVELPYFVMELVPDALPLTEYAQTRHLSVAERLGLFRQVCDAVAYGHERGIVHRDLKPSNLLVDGRGHPKVIDFGVARGLDAGDRATTLTGAGQLVGTLQYMSPEQVSGHSGEADARADVYSLGIVLYELLAGRPAHDLSGRPLVEAARIVLEQRMKPLRSVNPAVPRHVVGIVHRCLAKDRESRFQTAGELSAAIGNGRAEPTTLALRGGRRSPRFARISLAGLTGSALILGGVYLMPPLSWLRLMPPSQEATAEQAPVVVFNSGAIRPPNVEAIADPATALMLQSAEIQRDAKSFRFAFCDVHQRDADAFLVQNVGMKKWMDQFMFPRVSYWAPGANDQEGMLVYRFDLGGVADSIHMRLESNCWDFFREAGGVGRGASAIEISRDGEGWVTLEDNIEPRRWGASIAVDKDLPMEVCGSDTLWVRVRCITESAPIENGYNVAQFARTRSDRQAPALEVTAMLRQTEPAAASQ